VTVIFESAIVPRFSLRDSRLTFRNVYVSRGSFGEGVEGDEGGQLTLRKIEDVITRESGQRAALATEMDEEKFSRIHLSLESVDVTLSLSRWLDGKGLVKDAIVKGVRGVIGKRAIVFGLLGCSF
jgi:distribution and morphology protein 31